MLFNASFHLKTTQMNVQCRLTLEIILYEFKLGYSATVADKDNCCVKGEGAVDYNNQMVQRISQL